jgi:hypothetical protein
MTITHDTHPVTPEPMWKRRGFRRLVTIGAVPALAIAWWLGSPLFLDRTVDEAFPVTVPSAEAPAPAPVPEAGAPGSGELTRPTAPAEPEEPVRSAVPAASGPVVVASGSFVDADAAHQGSGTATIYQVEGATVLRFEEFEVTNGPDLRVNLVMADGAMVDLGGLTGNIGSQNYDIPHDLDLSQVESVLIYCRAFSVPFAEAVLA